MKAMWLAVLAAALLASCEREGPAERAGEAIDRAGEKASRAIERTGENIRDAADGKN